MRGITRLVTLALTLPLVVAPAEAASEVVYKKALYAWPVSLDPVRMNDAASLVVSNLIYDGLLRFAKDLSVEGSLAESWVVSPDGKEIRFALRKDAQFHDQSPVTSNDVVSSLTRLLKSDSLVANYYLSIQGAKQFHSGKAKSVSGLKADGPNTVIIQLERPFPPIMSILAGGTAKVLPAAKVDVRGFFDLPVGSGPFKVIGLAPKGKPPTLQLEKFSGYKPVVAQLSRIDLVVYSEAEATRVASTGDVHDLANWPLVGTEDIFKSGQHMTGPVAATWIIGLNARVRPLRDSKTRQAFRDAFDTQAFRMHFYPDSFPSYGYVPPGLPGHRDSIASSAAVLKKPVREVIEIAIPQELARASEMAQWIESSMKVKGWKVHGRVMAWGDLMKRYTNKTLQAFLVSMNMDYPDPEFLFQNFQSKNSDNYSGIADAELDRLLKQARETRERQIRSDLYQKVVARLDADAPTINLFHPRTHLWAHRCVRGLSPNLLSDAVIDYRGVTLDEACVSSKGVQ